jgi:hypothetical protein
MFCAEFVCTFTRYLHAEFHIPISIDSLGITYKWKGKYKLNVADMLFCVLEK